MLRRAVLCTTLYLALAATLADAPAAAQQGTVRNQDIVIHFWPQQQRLASSLLPGDAGLLFPSLPADVLSRGSDVNVYLAPDPVRWDSLTGGRAPEWGAGVAFPQRDMIVIPGYVSDRGGTHTLPQVLRHELAHIALQRALPGVLIPRWFNEGYATWVAGQFDADAGWLLRLAFVTNRAPPLDSITLDWPLLQADARLAYLLSASAVRYLHSLGPPESFERFIRELAEHGDFEQALRSVYIVSSPQFERLWRTHVRRNYGWLQLLAQSMFVWLVITVLVMILFVVRRRRDRRRFEELKTRELPDEPAYWQDPPPEESAAGASGSPEAADTSSPDGTGPGSATDHDRRSDEGGNEERRPREPGPGA